MYIHPLCLLALSRITTIDNPYTYNITNQIAIAIYGCIAILNMRIRIECRKFSDSYYRCLRLGSVTSRRSRERQDNQLQLAS